ncbi:MAG TPA: MFS transporter [Solirubrobacterales bacterium]|nr:MFS transporter [Solirubrobacterales bacterium]
MSEALPATEKLPATATGLSRWTLWFGGLAFFTCYLGQTVLGVIQPTISADLGLSASEAQWVVNSFFLAMALFAAPGGRLGDYYGHRQVLLVALAVFALGSLAAAASQGFVWLIVGIGIAGAGASTLYPSSAAMIANRVGEAHRGDALGKYSAIGITVLWIGPLMAGLLTEAVSWRALFGLQLLVGVAVGWIGWRRVDNRAVGEPARFDTRGLAILAIGLTALLVSLMQALAWGWDAPATIALFAAGVAVLGVFAAVELRTADPLLDIGLLRRRVLVGIVLAMFAAQFIINGYLIYVATYFQHVLGFSPLLAALAIVPSVITQPVFNIVAGRLTDRVGARAPATAGYLLTAVAFAWIALTVDDDAYLLLLPGLLLLGISIAPMFTSLLTGLSNAVAADERGDANALVLTVRWIGAATGTMVLGVVVYSGGDLTPSPSPYATAFTILSAAALFGALACAALLRAKA